MGIKFEFLNAGNGDCIWITTDEGINILIDGGWTYTYDGKNQKSKRVDIKTKVAELRKNNKKLDLVILTHYDDDHIFGISKLIEAENKYKSKTVLKEIWFNAFEKAKFPLEDDEYEDIAENQIKHKTGAKTQKKFEKFIENIKDYIDYEESGNLISIDKIRIPIEKEKITLLSPYTDKNYKSTTDITITLLSPNSEKLNECEKLDYRKKTANQKKERDWDKNIKDLLESIKYKEKHPNPKDFLDSSKPNGSSIAFILDYDKNKYLFLGDAHIDLIVQSLENMNYNKENPLVVDFVKLSHHGSIGNINKEFLSLIKTNQFIILANGNKSHWHPDKETLVMIMDYYKNNNEKISFIFNYEIKDIFGKDFELFKNDDISPYNFELICKTEIKKG